MILKLKKSCLLPCKCFNWSYWSRLLQELLRAAKTIHLNYIAMTNWAATAVCRLLYLRSSSNPIAMSTDKRQIHILKIYDDLLVLKPIRRTLSQSHTRRRFPGCQKTPLARSSSTTGCHCELSQYSVSVHDDLLAMLGRSLYVLSQVTSGKWLPSFPSTDHFERWVVGFRFHGSKPNPLLICYSPHQTSKRSFSEKKKCEMSFPKRLLRIGIPVRVCFVHIFIWQLCPPALNNPILQCTYLAFLFISHPVSWNILRSILGQSNAELSVGLFRSFSCF